eukprot:SAG31_NODE_39027_length_291_cov_1.067708_1_plen_28_part_01
MRPLLLATVLQQQLLLTGPAAAWMPRDV